MDNKKGNILIIDDDQDVLVAAQLLLKRHFVLVKTDDDPHRLREHLKNKEWDVVLLDMNFDIGANTGQEGLHWLEYIKQHSPSTAVILMTAYGAVDTAVQAIKNGAIDFVLKPWQNERLLTTVIGAMRLKESHSEIQHLKSREREIVTGPVQNEMIGTSSLMQDVSQLLARVAPTDANVLILGENGTGKEIFARELYRLSTRSNEIMVTVDVASITESLFESELFGHIKGAFTGAETDRIGRFQAASGGTLFLDEIGNLPLPLQGKLLSALEQRKVIPVGSNKPVAIDVRLICATNMPLKKMVKEGSFREDLLYRINTVEICIPALRKKTSDIPLLLEYFISLYSKKYNLPHRTIAADALAEIKAYAWPGNIRELRHAVERAVIVSDSENPLTARDLLISNELTTSNIELKKSLQFDNLNLEFVEEKVIEQALHKHIGNISHAAKELGITRTSLYRRMDKYGL